MDRPSPPRVQRLQELCSAVTKLDVKGIFDTGVDHRISDSPWYKPDFDSHACRDELCGQKASGTSSAVVPSSGLITTVEKIGTSSAVVFVLSTIGVEAAEKDAKAPAAEVLTVESDATNEVCAQRDQAARGHPGNRAERETCPWHPVRARSPKVRASEASTAEESASAPAEETPERFSDMLKTNRRWEERISYLVWDDEDLFVSPGTWLAQKQVTLSLVRPYRRLQVYFAKWSRGDTDIFIRWSVSIHVWYRFLFLRLCILVPVNLRLSMQLLQWCIDCSTSLCGLNSRGWYLACRSRQVRQSMFSLSLSLGAGS